MKTALSHSLSLRILSLVLAAQLAQGPYALAQQQQVVISDEAVARAKAVATEMVDREGGLAALLSQTLVGAEQGNWEFLLPGNTKSEAKHPVKAIDISAAFVGKSIRHFYAVSPVQSDVGARVGFEIKITQVDSEKMTYVVGVYDSNFKHRYDSRTFETDYSKSIKQTAVEHDQLRKVMSAEVLKHKRDLASISGVGSKVLNALLPNVSAVDEPAGLSVILGLVGFAAAVAGSLLLFQATHYALENSSFQPKRVVVGMLGGLLLYAAAGASYLIYRDYKLSSK